MNDEYNLWIASHGEMFFFKNVDVLCDEELHDWAEANDIENEYDLRIKNCEWGTLCGINYVKTPIDGWKEKEVKCKSCNYIWKGDFDAGKGRVAFNNLEDGMEHLEEGEVVCSMCCKGVEEYIPDDEM